MKVDEMKFEGPGWGREHVSIRLTPNRKTRLLSLARELPPDATPTDAIDRSLDLAIASIMARGREKDFSADIDELRSALVNMEARLGLACAHASQSIADLSGQLASAMPLIEETADDARRVREVVDAATDDDEGSDDAQAGAAPLSIRDWIARETLRVGASAAQTVALRAEWMATRKTSQSLLAMDFSCELLVVDDRRANSTGPSSRSTARVNLIASDCALAKGGASDVACLVCERRDAGAWLLRFHALNAQRKIGAMIASLLA
ncbi:hypothetical protein [Trinickia acidisoli]|uniref:hypothetical protein n=1 Tax=Trinickia acidisoli TaxID=2767482 RepID=UPI001A90C99E|nr:hypothetical protein [Trinickia acidisoli]